MYKLPITSFGNNILLIPYSEVKKDAFFSQKMFTDIFNTSKAIGMRLKDQEVVIMYDDSLSPLEIGSNISEALSMLPNMGID